MWMKRGLCGLIDIRTQTLIIAGFCMFLGCFGFVYGFVMVQSPELTWNSAVKVEEVIDEQVEERPDSSEELANITASLKNGTMHPNEGYYHELGLVEIQRMGVKVIVTGLVTGVIAFILWIGAKQDKSLYFVPWLSESIVALFMGVVQSLIYAMGGFLTHLSAGDVIFTLSVFVITCLFIYSVLSHFLLLRKMKKHSKEIINSVMNGQAYQTANYEAMTGELGREMTVVPPGRSRSPENPRAANRDDILYFSI